MYHLITRSNVAAGAVIAILLVTPPSHLFAGTANKPLKPALAAESRSTLATISLQSLDSEDLEDAVIGDSLDAPAAGESLTVPELLKEKTVRVATPYDTREDVEKFNISTEFRTRQEPSSTNGVQYDRVYQFSEIPPR